MITTEELVISVKIPAVNVRVKQNLSVYGHK